MRLDVPFSVPPGQFILDVYAPNVLKLTSNITVDQSGDFTMTFDEQKGVFSLDFVDEKTGRQENRMQGKVSGSELKEMNGLVLKGIQFTK